MLILVGNGPRTYREALGKVLSACRPMDRVVLIEPEQLRSAVGRLAPAVVLCDPHVSHIGGDSVWIELDGTDSGSPDHADEARSGFSWLHEVLEVIERAARGRPDG